MVCIEMAIGMGGWSPGTPDPIGECGEGGPGGRTSLPKPSVNKIYANKNLRKLNQILDMDMHLFYRLCFWGK